MSDATEVWDDDLAASILGKTILIGLTRVKADGTSTDDQLFGEIVSASPGGILVSLGGERAGQEWNMPPTLNGIRVADPGTYRLRATGEEVVDPDFTVVWTINDAAN